MKYLICWSTNDWHPTWDETTSHDQEGKNFVIPFREDSAPGYLYKTVSELPTWFIQREYIVITL
jgi:hypothetical protein